MDKYKKVYLLNNESFVSSRKNYGCGNIPLSYLSPTSSHDPCSFATSPSPPFLYDPALPVLFFLVLPSPVSPSPCPEEVSQNSEDYSERRGEAGARSGAQQAGIDVGA